MFEIRSFAFLSFQFSYCSILIILTFDTLIYSSTIYVESGVRIHINFWFSILVFFLFFSLFNSFCSQPVIIFSSLLCLHLFFIIFSSTFLLNIFLSNFLSLFFLLIFSPFFLISFHSNSPFHISYSQTLSSLLFLFILFLFFFFSSQFLYTYLSLSLSSKRSYIFALKAKLRVLFLIKGPRHFRLRIANLRFTFDTLI